MTSIPDLFAQSLLNLLLVKIGPTNRSTSCRTMMGEKEEDNGNVDKKQNWDNDILRFFIIHFISV